MAHDFFEFEFIPPNVAITAFRKNSAGKRYGRTQTEFALITDALAQEAVMRGHQDTLFAKFDQTNHPNPPN